MGGIDRNDHDRDELGIDGDAANHRVGAATPASAHGLAERRNVADAADGERNRRCHRRSHCGHGGPALAEIPEGTMNGR